MSSPADGGMDGVRGSSWDVVVVGAGPAGAMAARELARRGAHVLLTEKKVFPRYKVCGGCLNARALEVLSSVGLEALSVRCGGVPLVRFELAAGGRKASLSLPGGVALSRQVLDTALAEAAQSEGVRFISGTRAVLEEGSQEGWVLSLKAPQWTTRLQARVVLAADGLGQRLLGGVAPFESPPVASAHIGAGVLLEKTESPYDPGIIYMAVAETGYVGLVRVERERLNIAAALDPDAVRQGGGIAATVRFILRQAGYPLPRELQDAQWRRTPPLTRRANCLSAHRLLVLGDAAGYVEPFTGEGMAWALSTGRAAAALVRGALDTFDDDTEKAWAERYAQLTARSQWRCRAIATTLRRPLLVNLVTRALGCLPALAGPVITRLNTVVEEETYP